MQDTKTILDEILESFQAPGASNKYMYENTLPSGNVVTVQEGNALDGGGILISLVASGHAQVPKGPGAPRCSVDNFWDVQGDERSTLTLAVSYDAARAIVEGLKQVLTSVPNGER